MLPAMRWYLAVLAAGCASAQHPAPREGTITGLARDRDSGTVIAHAAIHVRAEGSFAPHTATTERDGGYEIGHLAPGRYSLTAEFAGQPIDIEHIDVRAGATTIVDVTFTLGQPDRVQVDFGDPSEGAIAHYRSPHVAPERAIIEGTVTDSATRAPVPGASVTATSTGGTLEAVTDDHGRYRFDAVMPGAYVVSVYYSITGRGQMEVRRSNITLRGGDGVIVPIWVELEKQ
jgi:hypothetical protein